MVLPLRLRRLPRAPSELHLPTIEWYPKFHYLKFHFWCSSASAALAGAFLALKEAIEPVQPVEPVEPVEPVKALAVAVLAEGQEAVQVEVLSVALQQAVQVEVELGAQA